MTEQLTPPPPEDYDAHETAKPNEPTFTVQGGDVLAPPTVQHYADLCRASARSILRGDRASFEPEHEGEEYTPSDRDMIDADKLLRRATSSEMKAADMIAYQRGEETVEDVDVYRDREQTIEVRKALIRGVSKLNNAVAEANDVVETLTRLGVNLDVASRVSEAVETIRNASLTIDPRRGNERS